MKEYYESSDEFKCWSNSLQKEVKTDKYKFRGEAPKTARIEEVLEEAEFDTIFEDKGVLVQPAPTNKQAVNSIIKEFVSNPNAHMFRPNNQVS